MKSRKFIDICFFTLYVCNSLFCVFQLVILNASASRPGAGITFSTWSFVRPSVHSFVANLNYEHTILKTNQPILLQIGTTGPRSKEMKRSTVGVRGQGGPS